jgi:lipopolysaccharide transport protein LptA
MRISVHLNLRICAGALAVAVFVLTAHGQPRISGRISEGFQAPTSMDDQGRRHVLKGNTAEPRGKDLYELTEPRVISYNAQDEPEMFIESARCFYEMKQNFAYSDATLSVRTGDGKFGIEGVGWRWNPEAGNLVISNKVIALVQKAALASNVPGGIAARTAKSETNAPVRITANSFVQEGETASFVDNVLVQDGPDTLRCDRLNLQFVKPGGVQVIEAVGNFVLNQVSQEGQGAGGVRSGRASYNLKENLIRITEKPEWESEGRSGVADSFVFDRNEGKIFADGNVFMKLPLTNVTDAAEVAATPDRGQDTNRFLQIHSDKFRFEEATSNRFANAFYEGQVRVVYTDATIAANSIEVGFNASNRVERVVANDDVMIDSRGNKAFGKRAEYELAEDKIVLTGDPRWELERASGRSETLIFYPKTKEVLALKEVEMVLAGQSLGGMFGVNVKTNQEPAATTPLVVRAETFSRGTNVAVFHKNVSVTDARGRMSCEILTLGIGASNQVERVLVENSVRIEQQGFTATGERGDYNAATGLVHLTGNPQLIGEDKTLRAEGFIIDRNANTFSVVPGRYRIEMKIKEGTQPTGFSPIRR